MKHPDAITITFVKTLSNNQRRFKEITLDQSHSSYNEESAKRVIHIAYRQFISECEATEKQLKGE